MPGARREYNIAICVFLILLAIGIPALDRGELAKGWICVGLAMAFAVWVLGVIRRDRS